MANDKKSSEEKDEHVGAALLDDKIAAAVARGMEAALPLAMAAAARELGMAMNPQKAKVDAATQEFGSQERCPKCLQMKRACKDNHVKLVVAPANPRRFARCPGIIINGVSYLSPRPGAWIWVPAENDITQQMQAWEEEEENLRGGRSLNHDSGTLSPVEANNKTNPANTAGFRGFMSGSPT